jgi:hypothetical protein
VLVKMEMTDEAYHLIKNTPKVTGFLGSGSKPMPVSERKSPGSSAPSKRASSGRSRPSSSRSARPCGSPTARSPASTARWNRSTRNAPACA